MAKEWVKGMIDEIALMPWEANGPYVFAGKNCIAICDTDNATKARMGANAKMMAAAPEMYMALAERALPLLEKHAHQFNHEHRACEVIREALAKARG